MPSAKLTKRPACQQPETGVPLGLGGKDLDLPQGRRGDDQREDSDDHGEDGTERQHGPVELRRPDPQAIMAAISLSWYSLAKREHDRQKEAHRNQNGEVLDAS